MQLYDSDGRVYLAITPVCPHTWLFLIQFPESMQATCLRSHFVAFSDLAGTIWLLSHQVLVSPVRTSPPSWWVLCLLHKSFAERPFQVLYFAILPLYFIHPRRLRHVFTVKAYLLTPTSIAFAAWALSRSGGFQGFAGNNLSKTELAWGWVSLPLQ